MKVFSSALAMLFVVASALAGDKVPAKSNAAPTNVLSAECVSFKDKQLIVKLKLDESFEKYVASQFAYPRQGGMKNAHVGELYLLTSTEIEAAHNVKQAQRIDEKRPPETIPDRSLIGKVVAVSEKTATIEWAKGQDLKKFFGKQQTFRIWNDNMSFTEGQVLRLVFGPDNRHCSPYPLKEKKGK